jgi:16S rRNA (adenine1518-N6/adenine1519-N6)-dimethyltransferase
MKGARRLVDALRAKQPTKKSLGQHFLVHDDVLEQTVEWAEVDVEDHVLEVGPGPGVLTEVLLAKGCKVTAVELDGGACAHLRSVFATELDEGRLVLVEGDALTVSWPKDVTRVVANIPYQISSPLIDVITRQHRDPKSVPLQDIVILVQEEFAERVVMEYESDVGSLGMVVALDFDADLGQRVPPHAFSPMPKVHSRLLRMTPHGEEWPCDRRLLVQMIRTAFEQRRKKLKGTLRKPPRRLGRVPGWHATRWKRAYNALEHDPRLQRRPETMELDEWAELGVDFTSCEEEA